MAYHIKSVDLFVRPIPAPRMDFSIGKGQSLFPDWMRGNVEVRIELTADHGRSAVGFAADWPSFGWLDKRPDVPPKQKLKELLRLIELAGRVFQEQESCNDAFGGWWSFRQRFLQTPQAKTAVPLCNTFATALFERGLIDGVCRASRRSFFQMLTDHQLGFAPGAVYPELHSLNFPDCLPHEPLARIQIRHTVGLGDPLLNDELNDENRIDDGLPQSLEQYVDRQGITFIKVKVSGQPAHDLARLEKIWGIVGDDSHITLDGNESFGSVELLSAFVQEFQSSLPEVFERTRFIEQPLPRAATHNAASTAAIQNIAKSIPLIIDEADGYLTAFGDAMKIGYAGVSHKNCKGIFKSLANFAMCHAQVSGHCFLSAEDLTNMPLTASHQDFAVVAALGLSHAERNAHHYFAGLAHLSEMEVDSAVRDYGRLYAPVGDNVCLNVSDGQVDLSKLQCPGLGVIDEPNWEAMVPLDDWLGELA